MNVYVGIPGRFGMVNLNLNKSCRFCFCDDTWKLMPITTEFARIENIFGVKVADKTYPKYQCVDCFQMINGSYKFKSKLQDCELTLSHYYRLNKKDKNKNVTSEKRTTPQNKIGENKQKVAKRSKIVKKKVLRNKQLTKQILLKVVEKKKMQRNNDKKGGNETKKLTDKGNENKKKELKNIVEEKLLKRKQLKETSGGDKKIKVQNETSSIVDDKKLQRSKRSNKLSETVLKTKQGKRIPKRVSRTIKRLNTTMVLRKPQGQPQKLLREKKSGVVKASLVSKTKIAAKYKTKKQTRASKKNVKTKQIK